jgi:uncharacterized protein (DUF1697 family)
VRTHAALLRGVNVGGRNRVAMADLRDVVAGLGHRDVATYIQSGNVVLTSDRTGTDALATEIEDALAERTGVRAGVVVVPRDELAAVVAANPYPDEDDPKHLHVVFHRGGATRDAADVVAAAVERARAKGSPDEATVAAGTLYLHTPAGLGRSELAAQLARPGVADAAGATATIRNWATVTRLLAMLDE